MAFGGVPVVLQINDHTVRITGPTLVVVTFKPSGVAQPSCISP